MMYEKSLNPIQVLLEPMRTNYVLCEFHNMCQITFARSCYACCLNVVVVYGARGRAVTTALPTTNHWQQQQ